MKLRVKSIDDNNHDFEIDDNSTVGMLKQKVAELYGIPQSEITLIFSGRVISNSESTLGSIGLTDDCTIHMIKKLVRPPNSESTTQPLESTTTNATNDIPTGDNPQIFNIELHTAVATLSNIPDSLLQYLNQINPVRSQHQQRSRELSRQYPTNTTQDGRNDELEFTYAKLNCAIDDWNRYYPSYNLYVESDGLLPSTSMPASSSNNDNSNPSSNNNFDIYYGEFMRHLSGMLTRLDCLRDVIRTTLLKLKIFSEVSVNSDNIEDMQFRINSTMNRFCRLMAIFSIMMQQMSSVKFSFNNNEPFSIQSSTLPLMDSIQETTLHQSLGSTVFSINSQSTNNIGSGITIPIVASMDNIVPNPNSDPNSNSNNTINPPTRFTVETITPTTVTARVFSTNPNGNLNSQTQNAPTNPQPQQRNDDSNQQNIPNYQSIIRDIVRPILNSLSQNTTPTNRTNTNDNSTQASQSSTSTNDINIPSANPNQNDEENHITHIRSLPYEYSSILEHDYIRCRNAISRSLPPLKRSFNYLNDISNNQNNIDVIQNTESFFHQPFSNFLYNTNEYNNYVRDSSDPNKKWFFKNFFESNDFNHMYRQFLRDQLIKQRSKYYDEDL